MSRTNIVLDDKLIAQAMHLTGAKTKREVVDIALRELVRRKEVYGGLLRLRGKLRWNGDLEAWRKSRV